ncbi:MAG: aromatic aminobenezylarsenical efflux permease ArsG family transporter [Alistipes sp.]
MEFLQSLLESSHIPFVTAFLLGILTAISPCPLATNITAIGYISKDIESKHRIFWRGILYTLGRIITYTVLGFILIPILREGASLFALQKAISRYGEMILSPALLLIGLFMLFGNKINLPNFGFSGSGVQLTKQGSWGALLLGVLFSLAFCPTSGVFYFGMLIPMAAAETGGFLLPIVFAIATGLPVIIVAWILAYSVAGLSKFYHRMQWVQKGLSRIVALLFIAVGVYYGIIYFL